MLLRQIAHARTGDKGRLVTISLTAYRAEDFPLLAARVTAEHVTQHFSPIIDRPALRYELPHLGVLNFVLQRPGTESVTHSLALDAHGKCLGAFLLALEI